MPQNCPSAQNLHAFYEGALSESELDAVANHLDKCSTCDASLRQLESQPNPLLSILRKRVRALSVSGDGRLPPTASLATVPEYWSSPPGYEIVAPLGRGGMGEVYSARQLSLNRLVALKRLRPDAVRSRAEAEALARLQHPGIVQIHEVVEHEGRIYLALELADAGSLRDRMTGSPESPRRAAEFVESLAGAVHYAHGLGIIHRDLKPANILLHRKAHSGGDTLDDLTPKVADFGVAKWLEREAGHTRDGEVVGTPAYMAPEQTAGAGSAVGPATDVYGLGVVLYELLTGRVPLQGPSTLDTLVMVRTEEPVPPRRLQPKIPRDLETICLKCLAKHSGHRYAGARDLADDLRLFLAGRPIVARPISGWERADKWARRHPAVAALSAAVVLIAALGFALVSWQWRRAERNAADEVAARRQVERLSAGFTLDRGVALCEAGDVRRGLLWLARALEVSERAEDTALAEVARLNLAAWQPFHIHQRTLLPHKNWVWTVAFSPDGRTILTGSADGTVRLWDAETGQPRAEPMRHPYPVWTAAFSPDGKMVVTGCGDPDLPAGEARLWDAETSRAIGPPIAHPARVTSVAFAADGQTVLTGCVRQIRLWHAPSGEPKGPPLAQTEPTGAAMFSPTGQVVATGGGDGTARLWEVATGKPKFRPLHLPSSVDVLAFSPDGRVLVTGCPKGGAEMWDVMTGERRGPTLGPPGRIRAIAFSPDGRIGATAGAVDVPGEGTDNRSIGAVQLWDVSTGRPIGVPMPHPQPVWAVAFDPTGRVLLTGSRDGRARYFTVASGAPIATTPPHEGNVTSVAFSRNGLAATASSGGDGYAAARVWDPPDVRGFGQLFLQSGEVLSLAFSPDGHSILAGADDRVARVWDLATGGVTDLAPAQVSAVTAVAFSPDGQTMIAGCQDKAPFTGDGDVRIWERATGRQRGSLPTGWVGSLAVTPDGKTIIVGDHHGAIQFWDAHGGGEVGRLKTEGIVWSLAVSRDGRRLVTGSGLGAILWDRESRHKLFDWPAGAGALDPAGFAWVAITPDDRQVIAVFDGYPRSWDLASGQPNEPPLVHQEGGNWSGAFTPDGRRMLVTEKAGQSRLWDVATGKPIGPPLMVHRAITAAVSPDGRMLAAGGAYGRIVIRDVPAPMPGSSASIRARIEAFTGLELDDRGGVRELNAEQIRQRHE